MKKGKPVASDAKMWPRYLFDCRNGKRLLVKELPILAQPGVYVLYRDDVPMSGKRRNSEAGCGHTQIRPETSITTSGTTFLCSLSRM
jgi:hypothetical protein